MAPRAIWKGWLKVGELLCPVALHTATSTSDRIAFHTVNRATGHRLRREFVDSVSGKPVERDDQVKGYEVGPDDYVQFEPEEIAAVVPDSDKTLSVNAFVPCGEVALAALDRPYFLRPSPEAGEEAFALIRDGLAAEKAAAVASTVLFRRVRSLLIRPMGLGMMAETLNFDYEIRPAGEVFAELPKVKVEAEMLDLARHIIGTKKGRFDPAGFEDRYEAAVAEMVQAKIEGRKLPKPKPRREEKVVNLLQALRESADAAGKARRSSARKTKAGGETPAARRKAG